MIHFPIKQPLKMYSWNSRTEASSQRSQLIHLRDDFMFQFYDIATTGVIRTAHRCVILNAAFTPIGEIDGTDLDEQQLGDSYVYTGQFRGEDHAEVNEKLYLAVVDANNNYYSQNYLQGGGFYGSEDLWTLSGGATITVNGLVASTGGPSFSGSAVYNLPLKIGSSYSGVITVTSISGGGGGGLKNGATVIQALSAEAAYSFTFTATSETLSVGFGWLGAGTIIVGAITLTMDLADVIPQHISTPFCVKDINDYKLLAGCSVNDYFNMFFADTNFIPRVRVFSEFRDVEPTQDIERELLTNGTINNYYASSISNVEFRIDLMPAYLVNFITTVFLLDNVIIDNVSYVLSDDINVVQNENSPFVKGYIVRLAQVEFAVGYKRVVTDPSGAICLIPTGGYANQYTDEIYQQQQTDETYYPQN